MDRKKMGECPLDFYLLVVQVNQFVVDFLCPRSPVHVGGTGRDQNFVGGNCVCEKIISLSEREKKRELVVLE